MIFPLDFFKLNCLDVLGTNIQSDYIFFPEYVNNSSSPYKKRLILEACFSLKIIFVLLS